MNEKRYLNWFNKIGYGSGDIAGNCVYALLSSFVMIYLTDTVGLNAGIVGTLMAVSKIFDGITDVFFGNMIDRTRSKMGKARPWMLWPYIGNVVCLVACFAIPTSWGLTAQYAFFFISYTMLNAVFFTANNIAYGALTALITKNGNERVQMGSLRFIFAYATSLVIQAITVNAVDALGGGAVGWKWIAVIYALAGLAINTFSVFSVKELPESELEHNKKETDEPAEKIGYMETAKLLLSNKYFILICGIYLMSHISNAFVGIGIYFMTYVMGDANLLGTFASFTNIPMMLICTALCNLGMSPMQGDLNALIAACSEYTYLKTGKRIDGSMFSATSLGVKLGGGLGTAITGILLDLSGYVNGAAVQSASALNMLNFMYLWVPMILSLAMTLLLSQMDVEKKNRALLAAQK